MKNLELAGPVERMPSTLINGIHSMPVAVHPSRSTGAVNTGDRADRCCGTATAAGVQKPWPGQRRSGTVTGPAGVSGRRNEARLTR